MIGRLTEPKSKLVWWAPRECVFDLPLTVTPPHDTNNLEDVKIQVASSEQKVSKIQTKKIQVVILSVFIQNIGKKKAENIDICLVDRPEHFRLFPSYDYEELKTPDGAHIIRIKILAPRDVVTLECFSPATLPVLNYIRTEEGFCERINFSYQRILPAWLICIYGVFALIGMGLVFMLVTAAFLGGLGILKMPQWIW